jgi:protein-disulfide isomerase
MGNPWFAVSTGLLGIIAGFVIGNTLITPVSVTTIPTQEQPTDTNPIVPTAEAADVDDDPVLGSADATITLIEFTDYQCPFCSRHYTQTYGQIKKDYIDTGKVKLVVRDYPLGFHPHAQKASEATECADEQGKFWEMHDKLFATQDTWSPLQDAVSTFKQYAAELKLNTSTFDTCLDSGAMASEVNKDMTDGQSAGIDGTPGFWIIGPDGQTKQISGAYPYETFKTAFEEML